MARGVTVSLSDSESIIMACTTDSDVDSEFNLNESPDSLPGVRLAAPGPGRQPGGPQPARLLLWETTSESPTTDWPLPG